MNEANEIPRGTGYLVVRVTTAGGALPLAGARVTVRGGTPEHAGVMAVRVSNVDGLSEAVALPTPPAADGNAPGKLPYAVYTVEVDLPGYRSAIYQNVPIFDRITAIQPAELLPLPEGAASGSDEYFESEAPGL